MARWKLLGVAPLLALLLFAGAAQAQNSKCLATAAARTATEGQSADLSCDLNRNLRTTGGGGGGAGDASAANQTSQITQETAIAGGVGTTADAAATQGSTGSASAKLRTLTAQMNTQAGYLDGIEALIATTNSNIASGTITTGTAGSPSSQVLSVQGIASGTALPASQSGTWTVQPGNTANTTAWKVDGSAVTQPISAASLPTHGVNLAATTTGGCTLGKVLSAASTNATSVKGSAGTLCSLTVINTTATLYYLKFYDKATAATCNSDTVLQTLPVPASTTGAGIAANLGPFGWAFPTGITFCLTGALADNDNTSAATGVVISYSYK